jgi:hypothetical protein
MRFELSSSVEADLKEIGDWIAFEIRKITRCLSRS